MLRFPIPLTGFEEYFHRTDVPEFPSLFLVGIELSKPLDRTIAEKALVAVTDRHPLSGCVVSDIGRSGFAWVKSDQAPKIGWTDGPLKPDQFPVAFIDIKNELPIKIVANDGSGEQKRGVIIFMIHHVAMDGLGFHQWISDWLAFYRLYENGDSGSSSLRPLNNDLLSTRSRPSLTFRERIRLLPGQWKSVRATFQVLKRTATPLVPIKSVRRSNVPKVPDVHIFSLSELETRQLKTTATKLDTTTNNVIARDLFVTVERWKQNNDIQTKGSHIRIMVPMNERRREHRKMPAANHCTLINLDRTPDETKDESALLASIEQEFGVINKYRLSLNFWRALSLFRILPGGIARTLDGNKVSATSLFTNVGRVVTKYSRVADEQKGKLTVTDFKATATLNQGMVASILLYYFRNRLHLSLLFDSESLSSDAAASFMNAFKDKLMETAGVS